MSGGGSNILRSAFSYCVQQVRNYDYHHYLCLLELPLEMRKPAFALRAFNVETARAMDVASDPKIGLMRLLWCQEAIDKIYTKKPINHPGAQALSCAISEHNISKPWLKRSVEARIRDAQRELDDIPECIEELEKYAEDTVSTLLYNTLQAGGISSTTADHAASHIGKASGLVNHYRTTALETVITITSLQNSLTSTGCLENKVADQRSFWIWIQEKDYATWCLRLHLLLMHIY